MKAKHNYIVLFISLLVCVASVASLFVLPDVIPLHWNMEGEIDGYGSKYFVLITGLLAPMVYLLMNVTKRVDPYEAKINQKIDTYYLMRDLLTLLMAFIGVVILLGIMVPNFNLVTALNFGLGVSFVVLGNYMPRVPHNYFLGAKTPWALNDEVNWQKTQRFSGYAFCLCGALMAISACLGIQWGSILAIVLLIISSIATYFYSWYIYKHS